MYYRKEFITLYSEIETMMKSEHHHNVDEVKFTTLKNEILDILKNTFGEASREYRVVKLTNSLATVFKVMNHIATRPEINIKTAVNM